MSETADSTLGEEQASVATQDVDSTHGEQADASEVQSLDDVIEAVFEASGEGEAKAEDPRSEQTDTGVDGDDANAAASPADGEPLTAPAVWSRETREAFARLPREAQRFVLDRKREADAAVTQKTQALSEHAKLADAVRSVFTDEDRRNLARSGLDEAGAVAQLVQLYRHSRQDPAGYVMRVMQDLGVRPEQIGLAGASQPNRSRAAPLEGRQGHQQSRQHGAPASEAIDERVNQILHQRAVADASTVLRAFAEETDGAGNLRHPHLEKVRDMMGALAQQPQYADLPPTAQSYRTLYDVAVRAHPDTREEVMAAERAREAEVEKARRAKGPKAGGTPPGAARRRDADLDDILADVFGAHGAL